MRSGGQSLPRLAADAPLAFVIMPFGLVFDQIYENLFVPMLVRAGYRVRRADTLLNQRAIMRDVIEGIAEADLVFADLTGGNANVFYELGIAHALKKRTVLVAQRRDDIPFDLRGYKNHVYRVEFAGALTLVDDLTPDLEPFLVAARKDEVLFGSPYADFAAPEDVVAEPEEEGGLLDALAEFNRRKDEYSAALQEAIEISDRFTEGQELLNAKLTDLSKDANSLDDVLEVVAEVGALWDAAATEMEEVLEVRLAPITMVVERGAKAMFVMSELGGEPDQETKDAQASIGTLAKTARDTAEKQMGLASMVRDNSKYAASLRKPGEKLATTYERFASTFDRIAALEEVEARNADRKPK